MDQPPNNARYALCSRNLRQLSLAGGRGAVQTGMRIRPDSREAAVEGFGDVLT